MDGLPEVLEYIDNHWDKTIPVSGRHPDFQVAPMVSTAPYWEGILQGFHGGEAYFCNLGLLAQRRVDLAMGNCETQRHLIGQQGFPVQHTGPGGKACASWPLLAEMVYDVFQVARDLDWVRGFLPALETELCYWMNKRMTRARLNRFYGEVGTGGSREEAQERAQAESLWPNPERFHGRPADFVAVELNSLLWLAESRTAELFHLCAEEPTIDWKTASEIRKSLINRYLWNEERGYYVDFDMSHNRREKRLTSAAFFPLWMGLASTRQASRQCRKLAELTHPHGLALMTSLPWENPQQRQRAREIYVVAGALAHFGFEGEARNVASAFLGTVARVFGETGSLWTSYDPATGNPAPEAMPCLGATAGVTVALAKDGAFVAAPQPVGSDAREQSA